MGLLSGPPKRKSVDPANVSEVYAYFAEKHNWTPDQVAKMTPDQQMMLLEGAESGVRTFDTEAEAREYIRTHGTS